MVYFRAIKATITKGFKIKPTYDIRVYKAAGDDQVVGSDSKEKLVERFELCSDLIEIVGRTGIVSDVQLFKYKAKLLLRHRLVVQNGMYKLGGVYYNPVNLVQ